MLQRLGFRVQALGFRVQCSGFSAEESLALATHLNRESNGKVRNQVETGDR